MEHPTELEDLEESDYNQPRTLDGWGNTLLFTFEMLDKRRALKLVGVINQTNVPLETKIEFLDLLVTKRRLIGSSTYVREFLEISRQIYKQYQEHKIRGIDYVLLQDGLRDTLFKFVLPENEIGHKATWEIMAGRRKPTKEYFELVGVISREMESAPEGLRSFYARVIKFIKPEKGAQTTSMDNYDIPF